MPLKDKEANRAYQREWQRKHYLTHGRKYYETHKEKFGHTREKWLRQYGITEAQWEAAFEAQGRKCPICLTTDPERWHTDHCHTTDKFRGVLCPQCNVSLGNLKEDPAIFRRAVEYLDKHAGRETQ